VGCIDEGVGVDTVLQILEGLLNLIRDIFVGLGSLFGVGDYGAGFLSGLVVASIIGFVVYRLNIWMRNANAAYQPQRLVQMTARTPSEVVGASSAAMMKITGVLVIALTLALLVSGLADPQDAALTGGLGVVLLLIGGITG
jgi:hypothetical protein